MLVLPAVVVVNMRRDDVFRDGLDGVSDVAEQVRMPEVETDAGRLAVELVVEDRDERRRVARAGSG